MKYDVGGAPPLCPMFTRGRRDKGGVWFAVCAVCCVLCAVCCVVRVGMLCCDASEGERWWCSLIQPRPTPSSYQHDLTPSLFILSSSLFLPLPPSSSFSLILLLPRPLPPSSSSSSSFLPWGVAVSCPPGSLCGCNECGGGRAIQANPRDHRCTPLLGTFRLF